MGLIYSADRAGSGLHVIAADTSGSRCQNVKAGDELNLDQAVMIDNGDKGEAYGHEQVVRVSYRGCDRGGVAAAARRPAGCAGSQRTGHSGREADRRRKLSAGAEPPPGAIDKPSVWNMELLGHNDLQGRSAYQPTIVNQDGRFIAYVGHHDNQKPIMNPMTGKAEVNGTSVVDVTDPAKTKLLWRTLPPAVAVAQMTRVCSGDTPPHGVKGKWYLLRPHGNSASRDSTT